MRIQVLIAPVDYEYRRQTALNPPASFRDKHTFYDPHGAPPYVGVEHDAEDDGWRINWNRHRLRHGQPIRTQLEMASY
jgi:hypothetical protein